MRSISQNQKQFYYHYNILNIYMLHVCDMLQSVLGEITVYYGWSYLKVYLCVCKILSFNVNSFSYLASYFYSISC